MDDAAEGIVLASERYNSSEPVNLGSACEISIADLVARIARCVGYEGRIVFDPSKPNGQPRRKLDCNKAARCFGLRATTEFEEGLRRTVQWYLSSNTQCRNDT